MTRKKKVESLVNLGVIFRKLRLEKGYKSAEQFSFDFELNRTAYWRWENGENMTMISFLRLCSIHNISPKDVFEKVDSKFGASFVSDINFLNEPHE
jgi:transcriptional regulator with XRE-family HTH domain